VARMSTSFRTRRADLVAFLDALCMFLSDSGLAVLPIMVAVNWAAFLLTLLHRRPFWGG